MIYHLHLTEKISIHALREESDPNGLLIMLDDLDFNPRPPRGERQCTMPKRKDGV